MPAAIVDVETKNAYCDLKKNGIKILKTFMMISLWKFCKMPEHPLSAKAVMDKL